ncbi:MAG TPA: DUF4203 domain-containing protein [Anaerolineales bacterium]
MLTVVRVVVGLLLLALGKRLFWLFVAAVGFVATLAVGTQFFQPQSELTLFVIAVVAGFVGALLAVFAQKLAVGIAGFLAGGYLAIGLLGLFNLELGTQWWQPFVFGGILGALISYPLFDWALIVLSALTGAVLIVQALEIGTGWALPLTVLVALVGVTIQAGVLRRGRRPKPEPEPDPD